MALLLDINHLQLIQISNEEDAILCENFSWLLDNLYSFDPTHTTKNNKWQLAGRGNRRAERGDSSSGLGYKYDPQSSYVKDEKGGVISSIVSTFKKFMNAPSTAVKNKGYKTVNSFGYPIEVEQWEVTAPWPVTDTSKGETYNGPDGGGSYTCEITSRRELESGKKSRYYVSCNCKDFHYSFKQDLQDSGYTNPNETLPARGSGPTGAVAPHAPAICKHLYTILMKFYYDDFITKEKGPDPSAEITSDSFLGGLKSIFKSEEPSKDAFTNYTATLKSEDQLKAAISYIREYLKLAKSDKYRTSARTSNAFKELVLSTTKSTLRNELARLEQELSIRSILTQSEITKAKRDQLTALKSQGKADTKVDVRTLSKTEIKKRAERAIINAIQTADTSLNSDMLDSYKDTRQFSKRAAAPLHYHKYKFEVRVDTADGHASIYYINPKLAGSSSGQKVVSIPSFSKKDSYYLFTPQELRNLIMQYTTPMTSKVLKQLDKLRREQPVLFFEKCEVTYAEGFELLKESNNISSAISNFRGF